MEENKDDIIYDLEAPDSHAESAEERGARNPDNSESSDDSDNSDDSGEAVRMPASHKEADPHEEELRRMVEEMGAETLLSIIRDNRNAAIRQIISEVEASQDCPVPSGASASMACTSIFDLAALA